MTYISSTKFQKTGDPTFYEALLGVPKYFPFWVHKVKRLRDYMECSRPGGICKGEVRVRDFIGRENL